jgi:hypothetical protein
MSQTATRSSEAVSAESFVSDWFLKNYPNTSLGEMANFYREMRTEVPLLAIQENSYGSFYGRMTGLAPRADAAERKTLAMNEPKSAQTLGSLLPVAALLSLVGLTAASFVVYVTQ